MALRFSPWRGGACINSSEVKKRANTTVGGILPAIVALIVRVFRLATIGAHWSAIVMIAGAVLSC